eukprot:9805430-Ditylum_brightwellii.AAC.1
MSFLLFRILNHRDEEDADDNEDSVVDDDDSYVKDWVSIFHHATADISANEMFPQCMQFDGLYFSTSGL